MHQTSTSIDPRSRATGVRALAKVALALLLAPSIAWSAETGSLRGVVRDQSGAAIAGALVEALALATGKASVTKTDASGRWQMTGVGAGLYRVSAASAGFATAARSVFVAPRDDCAVALSLSPGAIVDEVTVTASKGGPRVAADTPQSITVTSADEIETRRPESTMQALARVPALLEIGANPMAARPRLRGLASNRVLIVVDGERLNNVRSDPASGISPAIVDVTDIASVEVLNGAGSSLYGSDAIAGTINLVSKDPARVATGRYLGVRLDGDARTNGAFGRGAARLTFSTPRFAVRAGGSSFSLADYRAGGESIPLAEVVRIGAFANEIGAAAGTDLARSYAVWRLPADGQVPNGQARGFYSQADVWLFLSPSQSVRARQVSNQHTDVGFAFLTPPFDVRRQSNDFRRLDKTSVRYEAHDLADLVPHVAVGLYRQKYVFPDDLASSSIDPGSSWIADDAGALALTGDASTFTPATLTDGKSAVTSYGADAQVTLAPSTRMLVTTGFGLLRDASTDAFSRIDLSGATSPVSGRASTPDTVYRNLSWSNLVEYEPLGLVRLSGGLRVDNWRTKARVTPGFPLGTESAIVRASFGALEANPGEVDVAGAAGIVDVLDGRRSIETARTSVTGNAALVVRLPGSVNPYVRWETSYREPGITERYILRDFGDRSFSLLLLPNTALEPERGATVELGAKVDRERWRATADYFRTTLRDFIGNAFAPVALVPADPANGLDALAPGVPFHGVLSVQRANTARARIEGVEASYEASVSLGDAGSMTPYGTMSWLKGTNLTPSEQTLALVRTFFERDDTPVALHGSVDDVPLSGIAPFGGVFGVRYGDRRGDWIAEYEARYRGRVSRVDPTDLSTAIGTQYGSFASLASALTHSARVAYSFRRERCRLLFTAGVDNLTNRLYFDPFQTAPAPGRSFAFGVTVDASDLLRR